MENAIKIVQKRLKYLQEYVKIPYMNDGTYMITQAKIVELEELLDELQIAEDEDHRDI